ncbi:MAG: response regulator [Lachnospiraceae bacterium]|jgi:signal transduction histidine kinase/DNA-binding response OmpR family regulator|nr:response regulator [Lachnospiraceae bacterium]
MNEKLSENQKKKEFSLLLSIIAVFCILGAIVFSVAQKLSNEMSASAIQSLSENLNLIKSTIEAILNNEAEFQNLIAREISSSDDPIEYVRSYEANKTMVKLSLVMAGETEGVSSKGEVFSEEELDFSGGGTVNGLPISKSYLNHMGAWAYTMKCPIMKDGSEMATLYIEYTYEALNRFLPNGFYNNQAVLYIMDAESQRFVLKPEGMGLRSAGHLNLTDFYRANSIEDPQLRSQVQDCLESGKNILFYHDIRQVNSLNYMWSLNGGTIYLVGYVALDAIQQEGRTVNQNILLVVSVMLVAFFLCCTLYYFNQRQHIKIRKEREAERELHNKQLTEALQAAQIANQSKTMFLSNMSHDIRTPMNAVLGFTTLLGRDAENPVKVREYTKKITASGQHLLSLINDILDVSKIESGKVVLTFEEFSLNDVISSVDAIIQPMARARGQNFHLEVTGIRHEYLMGDETRINQILINLLSNAVKYTPEGGNIWFRITGLKQRSKQYEHILIQVEDDGYGMTPEYLKTIFDAFTRAENSTTNKVQGTGLGMAITKNIVELMGGSINVSSEVGKGSLFEVELECRIPERQADRQFWKECGISRILVIDSHKSTCEGIQTLMEDVGVQVTSLQNGEEALESLQNTDGTHDSYDLILFDYNKSENNGADMVQRLRDALPDTVLFLLLTNHHSDRSEGCLPQNIGTLAKPFFVSALKEKIRELKNSAAEPKTDNHEGNSLEGFRLLAAEDNEINAEILSEILKMEGASYEIVENGQLAVERFEHSAEGEFHAILMDVQMPVMNGYQAAMAIRAMSRKDAAQIPIIAMTANAFAEDEKAALDAGMNAHVAKPLDIELAKKVIREYCMKGTTS